MMVDNVYSTTTYGSYSLVDHNQKQQLHYCARECNRFNKQEKYYITIVYQN